MEIYTIFNLDKRHPKLQRQRPESKTSHITCVSSLARVFCMFASNHCQYHDHEPHPPAVGDVRRHDDDGDDDAAAAKAGDDANVTSECMRSMRVCS